MSGEVTPETAEKYELWPSYRFYLKNEPVGFWNIAKQNQLPHPNQSFS
jgi:hypothetical protein